MVGLALGLWCGIIGHDQGGPDGKTHNPTDPHAPCERELLNGVGSGAEPRAEHSLPSAIETDERNCGCHPKAEAVKIPLITAAAFMLLLLIQGEIEIIGDDGQVRRRPVVRGVRRLAQGPQWRH